MKKTLIAATTIFSLALTANAFARSEDWNAKEIKKIQDVCNKTEEQVIKQTSRIQNPPKEEDIDFLIRYNNSQKYSAKNDLMKSVSGISSEVFEDNLHSGVFINKEKLKRNTKEYCAKTYNININML